MSIDDAELGLSRILARERDPDRDAERERRELLEGYDEELVQRVSELLADFRDEPEQVGQYLRELEGRGEVDAARFDSIVEVVLELAGPNYAERVLDPGHDGGGELGATAEPDVQAARALQHARRASRVPLPHREAMEQLFGVSFDNVEVHEGPEAREANQMVGARAFTVGNVIALGEESVERETVAHELTHVVQQGGHESGGRLGSAPERLPMTSPGDAHEQEAEHVGATGVPPSGGAAEVATQGAPRVARLDGGSESSKSSSEASDSAEARSDGEGASRDEDEEQEKLRVTLHGPGELSSTVEVEPGSGGTVSAQPPDWDIPGVTFSSSELSLDDGGNLQEGTLRGSVDVGFAQQSFELSVGGDGVVEVNFEGEVELPLAGTTQTTFGLASDGVEATATFEADVPELEVEPVELSLRYDGDGVTISGSTGFRSAATLDEEPIVEGTLELAYEAEWAFSGDVSFNGLERFRAEAGGSSGGSGESASGGRGERSSGGRGRGSSGGEAAQSDSASGGPSGVPAAASEASERSGEARDSDSGGGEREKSADEGSGGGDQTFEHLSGGRIRLSLPSLSVHPEAFPGVETPGLERIEGSIEDVTFDSEEGVSGSGRIRATFPVIGEATASVRIENNEFVEAELDFGEKQIRYPEQEPIVTGTWTGSLTFGQDGLSGTAQGTTQLDVGDLTGEQPLEADFELGVDDEQGLSGRVAFDREEGIQLGQNLLLERFELSSGEEEGAWSAGGSLQLTGLDNLEEARADLVVDESGLRADGTARVTFQNNEPFPGLELTGDGLELSVDYEGGQLSAQGQASFQSKATRGDEPVIAGQLDVGFGQEGWRVEGDAAIQGVQGVESAETQLEYDDSTGELTIRAENVQFDTAQLSGVKVDGSIQELVYQSAEGGQVRGSGTLEAEFPLIGTATAEITVEDSRIQEVELDFDSDKVRYPSESEPVVEGDWSGTVTLAEGAFSGEIEGAPTLNVPGLLDEPVELDFSASVGPEGQIQGAISLPEESISINSYLTLSSLEIARGEAGGGSGGGGAAEGEGGGSSGGAAAESEGGGSSGGGSAARAGGGGSSGGGSAARGGGGGAGGGAPTLGRAGGGSSKSEEGGGRSQSEGSSGGARGSLPDWAGDGRITLAGVGPLDSVHADVAVDEDEGFHIDEAGAEATFSDVDAFPGLEIKDASVQLTYSDGFDVTVSTNFVSTEQNADGTPVVDGALELKLQDGEWQVSGNATLAVDGVVRVDNIEVAYQDGQLRIRAEGADFDGVEYQGAEVTGRVDWLEYSTDAGAVSGEGHLDATFPVIGTGRADVVVEDNSIQRAELSFDSNELAYPEQGPVVQGTWEGAVVFEEGRFVSGELSGDAQFRVDGLNDDNPIDMVFAASMDEDGQLSGRITLGGESGEGLRLNEYLALEELTIARDGEGEWSGAGTMRVTGIRNLEEASLSVAVDESEGFRVTEGEATLQVGSEEDRLSGTLNLSYDAESGFQFQIDDATLRLDELSPDAVARGSLTYDHQSGEVQSALELDGRGDKEGITLWEGAQTERTFFETDVQIIVFTAGPVSVFVDAGLALSFSYGIDPITLGGGVEIQDLDLQSLDFRSVTVHADLGGAASAEFTPELQLGLGAALAHPEVLSLSGGLEFSFPAETEVQPQLEGELTYEDGELTGGASIEAPLAFGITATINPRAWADVLSGVWSGEWTGAPIAEFELLPPREVMALDMDFAGGVDSEQSLDDAIPDGETPPNARKNPEADSQQETKNQKSVEDDGGPGTKEPGDVEEGGDSGGFDLDTIFESLQSEFSDYEAVELARTFIEDIDVALDTINNLFGSFDLDPHPAAALALMAPLSGQVFAVWFAHYVLDEHLGGVPDEINDVVDRAGSALDGEIESLVRNMASAAASWSSTKWISWFLDKGAEVLGQKVGEFIDTIGGLSEDVAERLSNYGGDVGDAVTSWANDAYGWASNTVESGADTVGDTYNSAKDTVSGWVSGGDDEDDGGWL